MSGVSGIDTSVAHPARVYDYWLDGKDNFAADREASELILQAYPQVVHAVRSNRAFLTRAVRFLASEAGIRQFLDIGTGMPTANNTHEVAQAIASDGRIVYVDNDQVVLLHAQAMLTSSADGACDYVHADFRDTHKILEETAKTLDFSQATALMLLGVLHLIPDKDDPYALVGRIVDALPVGSYLVISHPTDDFNPNEKGKSMQVYNERVADTATLRGNAEIERFFRGLDLAEPGVVAVAKWRPRTDLEASRPSGAWCGVARKP